MHALKQRWSKGKEAGFGLVELIVVVAIIAVLVVIAIPVYGAIQNTAAQNAANDGARSTYGSIRAIYQSSGKAGALTAINKLNAGNPGILYLVRDEPTTTAGVDEEASTRGTVSAGLAATNGAGFTVATVLNQLNHPTEGQFSASTGAAIGGDPNGTRLCVVAFLKSGPTAVKHVGFAGDGCGPA